MKVLCSKGDTWLFFNVKRLEYFTGIEVHSVTVYGNHKSKCIAELTYIIHEVREERNVVIKKEQANLAHLALVIEVMMINTIHITYIFKNLYIKSTKNKLSRDFARKFHLNWFSFYSLFPIPYLSRKVLGRPV